MYWELHAVQCPAALLQQPRHWWRRGGSREHHTDPEEHPAKPNTNATQGIIASTRRDAISHKSTYGCGSVLHLFSEHMVSAFQLREKGKALSQCRHLALCGCIATSP